MKPLHAREIALVCAPILLIGGAFLIPSLLHPPKDPDAIIALSVVQKPSAMGFRPNYPSANFKWEATATGGPDYGYRFGYHQQVVALSEQGETIIYSAPPIKNLSTNAATIGGAGYTPGQQANMSQDIQIDGTSIPVTTKRLEWRGEIVAAPKKEGSTSAPASTAQLQQWSQIKGAARVVKTFPIAFDAAKYAVPQFGIEPVNPSNASHGSDTCVVVRLRDEARTICRRLVAFDGQKHRVLWDDNSDGFNRYWQGREGDMAIGFRQDIHLFRLKDVPLAWGEITFWEDVVFTGDKSNGGEQTADLKTLDKLESAGGLRFRRHVVVRTKGKTTPIPFFQKTPNLQFQGLKTRRDSVGTHILVSLRYIGPRVAPEIDVPGELDVSDAKGKVYMDVVKSYSVKRGADAKQWVLEVDLKNLGKSPHKLRLNTEVADNDAAPLHIHTEFVLPHQ